ncbi:L,D-transpeptidase family protein [Methylosinus trichosporium]|uniref:Murein L,D-transpeptidase n=1 Tax=Methylosinus trichosporium (strain ATCC 35070 / NCIMB 11131 / UNIQEM 75 / OB3b) TaxID=595536 RepID=A0A2D2D625_METT3|nr:murein L,D-transpeptidase [Methylosinus trichosporium OB3b]
MRRFSSSAFAPLRASILAASLVSPAALAAGDGYGGQAEWAQRYDADPRLTVSRSTTPILSTQTVAATEAAIQQMQDIVARGGWPMVPAGQQLKLGSNSPAVSILRRRLMISGDIGQDAGASPIFDSYVEAAVRRFQARHGVNATGVVAQQTFVAMNVPAEARMRQLETNLIRLRSFSRDLGNRYVTANIPAASVETVENGYVVTHHIAGVGKIDRQSPVMQTKAIQINFNPFWTVPASVIRKDLIPKMQADPNYLTANHIRVYNKDGMELAPEQINWNSLDAMNYKFRQDIGGDFNSLGVVRIDIANPYGVYMHDTPAKGIFGDDFRFVSSGCIRLQNVRDYVAWLLKETPGWDRDHIDEVIRSGERVDVRITPAVPVYWVYVTAWAAPDGLIQFRDDIYQRDGLGLASAVSAPQPTAAATPIPQRQTARSAQPYPVFGEEEN